MKSLVAFTEIEVTARVDEMDTDRRARVDLLLLSAVEERHDSNLLISILIKK